MTEKILNNRYKLGEQIGSGGMSIVYKAFDLQTSQTVAVKILRDELSDDVQLVKKFNVEAEAAKRLMHPNIVRTLDVGCDEGVHYIVRDLIEGITLKELIDENGAIEPVRAAEIAYKIALGLQHAHSSGVIHRDIKPHNIIIGIDGTVKITDFGIAHIVSDATKTTEYGKNLIGTVYYTSPEQVRGLNVDERTDIYSLGVVLYEMVTGTLPFDGENAVNIAMQHVTKEPESARKLNKNINSSLDNIIKNAMAKKCENRYSSIDEMIRDLQKYISGQDRDIYVIGKQGKLNDKKNNDSHNNAKKQAKLRKKEQKRKKMLNSLLGNILLVIVLAGLLTVLIYGIYVVGDKIIDNNFIISTVEVPDISGETSENAILLLEKKQLIYRAVSSQYSSTVPKGCVVSQTPEAGEQVNEDTLVEVVISLGAFEIDIPNCVGKDLMTAEYELRSNGYIAIKYNYVESDEPENTIVKQSIPFGKYSLDGSYVTITFDVSKGPSQNIVIMKNYVGYTEKTLKQLASGFLIKITYEYSDTIGKDIVISQSVPAGTVLENGDEVHFVVSLGPQKVIKNTLTFTLDEYTLISPENTVYVEIKQIKNGKFTVVFSGDADVYDSQVSIDIEGSSTQTYYIYVNGSYVGSQELKFN